MIPLPHLRASFGMLLDVRRLSGFTSLPKTAFIASALALLAAASANAWRARAQALPQQATQGTQAQPASSSAQQAPAAQPAAVPAQLPPTALPPKPGLNIVVLDPAHGGTDPGARGTGGIRESDLVLDVAARLRAALEAQGLQVMQTRSGNENPSFDDRSAMANAMRGAIFITLHISSTGLPGTVRVYTMTDFANAPGADPAGSDTSGLIRWDRAQQAYLALSRRLADLVQGELAQRFKGSPPTSLTAAVRQLRTTAAPAIAVEISSVTVDDRTDLDKMIPGVADAVARGVVAFRPMYVTPSVPGIAP